VFGVNLGVALGAFLIGARRNTDTNV
jgi:hypothetical protein